MANRLAQSASPYLRQHAGNPVDWYPWGEEAFTRAREEQKPIFLSVGYSSCHWCHVMAHESFEDPQIGALLNQSFICVKLDREERPDVDDVYMTAVQLATGRGGWPMTLFLTPDLKPFFAGTYFPKEDFGEYPGFRSLVTKVASAWQNQRGILEESADEFATGLSDAMGRVASPDFHDLGPELFAEAISALHGEFDPDHGGFGSRPKFPPHTAIRFLLRFADSSFAGEVEGILPGAAGLAREMALLTMDKMALGGIHDQVGGGFHRYSTDERWLLPHFEKMLYDNAQILGSLALAQRHERRFGVIADRLVAWVDREMTSPEGLFYSALDADSDGEEGKFYVWSIDEIRQEIGFEPDFEAAFGIKPEGNFHDEASGKLSGFNILHRGRWEGDYSQALTRLLEARSKRTRPALDDKALACWNGMMMQALCEFGRPPLAAGEIWASHKRLPHQIVAGEPSGEAFLDDYAQMALAYLALHRATGESRWREHARQLAATMVDEFRDSDGAFWFTSNRHERLIGRSKPALDQSMPSANAAAIRCLIELGEWEAAEHSLRTLLGWMQRVPQATEALFDCALALIEHDRLSPQSAIPSGKVRASVEPLGTDSESIVVIDIPSGLHINTARPELAWLIPTRITSESPISVEYPAGEDRYQGRVEIRVHHPAEGRVELKLTYQVCSETECQAPTEMLLVARAD